MNPLTPAQPQPTTYAPFVATLITTMGEFSMASADNLPSLAAQAHYWLDMSTQGQAITDGQIQRLVVEHHDPATDRILTTTNKYTGKKKLQQKMYTVRSRSAIMEELNKLALPAGQRRFMRAMNLKHHRGLPADPLRPSRDPIPD